MGSLSKYEGYYVMDNPYIILSKVAYKNKFIPDTLMIDETQNAIFIKKDESGKFETNKLFLNHFEIDEIDITLKQ